MPEHSASGLVSLANDHEGVGICLGHRRSEAFHVGPAHRTKQDRMLSLGEHAAARPSSYPHSQAIK